MCVCLYACVCAWPVGFTFSANHNGDLVWIFVYSGHCGCLCCSLFYIQAACVLWVGKSVYMSGWVSVCLCFMYMCEKHILVCEKDMETRFPFYGVVRFFLFRARKDITAIIYLFGKEKWKSKSDTMHHTTQLQNERGETKAERKTNWMASQIYISVHVHKVYLYAWPCLYGCLGWVWVRGNTSLSLPSFGYTMRKVKRNKNTQQNEVFFLPATGRSTICSCW